MKDKLWFYATYKYEDNKTYVASSHVRRRQPRLPPGAGQLQRHRPHHVAGLAARQDPLLSREAVQRRVLQRLQHAADDDAGSVDRRVGPRLGAAGQVDADDVEQAAARSRHHLLRPAATSRLSARNVGPRDLPRLEQTTNRLSVAARQHDSALHQLDEDLQLDGLGQLHHRLARLQGAA